MIHLFPTLFRARRKLLVACAGLWIASFLVSHIPLEKMPPLSVSDKGLHLAGFFALGGLLLLTLAGYRVRFPRRFPVALASLAVYAAFDELTQALVNRHAELGDFAADVVGAAAGVILCEVFLRVFSRSNAPSVR